MRFLLVTSVLAAFCHVVSGQQVPPVADDIPDYVLFDSLFFRVSWLDGLVGKLAD